MPSASPERSIALSAELAEQADLGGPVRLVDAGLAALGLGGARWTGVPLAGVLWIGLLWVGALALLGAAVAVLLGAPAGWLLAAALLFVIAAGAARPRMFVGRTAWVVPSTLFALEVAVVALVQQAADPGHWAGAFAFCAAGAWRRYDVIYRRRDLGSAPAPWTAWVTLGVDGRLLLVAVAYALGPARLTTVLLVAAAVIGAFVVCESTVAWVRSLRRTGTP